MPSRWGVRHSWGRSKDGVDLLLTGVVFVDGVFFALTGAAAVMLMRCGGEDGVKVIGGWPVAALFVVGELGIVGGALVVAEVRWAPLIGVGWIAAAGVVYWVWFRGAGEGG